MSDPKLCSKCGLNEAPSYHRWCRPCINEYSRTRYATDETFRERSKQPRTKEKRNRLEDNRQTRKRLKEEVVSAYGGCCACCGDSHIEFLTVDHIDGRPDHHKGKNGYHLYCLVKKEGFPSSYRVLCWNCNASFGLFGYCPHQNKEDVIPPDTAR